MDYVLIILPTVPAKPRIDLAIKDKDGMDTGELREKTPQEIALEVDYSTKKQIYETVEDSAYKDWLLTGKYKTILGTGPTVTDKDKNEYVAQWIPVDRFEIAPDLKDFEKIPGLQVAITDNPDAWLTKAGFSFVIPAEAGIQ